KELYDMTADPGQKQDVAGIHPKVVAELRKAYEAWWADISKRFDEYCEIVIGSAKENSTHLACHDWHGDPAPSAQAMVLKGVVANGFWAIEAERGGKYKITLRRQPAVAKFPISANTARLKVGEFEVSQDL